MIWRITWGDSPEVDVSWRVLDVSIPLTLSTNITTTHSGHQVFIEALDNCGYTTAVLNYSISLLSAVSDLIDYNHMYSQGCAEWLIQKLVV